MTSRRFLSLLLALATAAVGSRAAFRAERLWDHDSVQFALGVARYQPLEHQPHPPGYPAYIGLLKALGALGLEPGAAMVWLAVCAAGLGTAAVVALAYHLVRSGGEAERRAAGQVAGVLFLANPVLWFYGELPLLYGLEAGVAAVLALGAWRFAESPRWQFALPPLVALAAGLRQSTIVLLGPLLVYGLYRAWRTRSISWRPFLAGSGLAVGVGLGWLVPLLQATGGWAGYRQLSAEHFGTLLPQTSILYGAGWPALAHNLEVVVKWTLQGLVPGLVALLLALISAPGEFWRGLRRALPNALLPALWVVPPVAFFLLFHVTKAGYTLVYQPALAVAVALLVAPALAVARWRRVVVGAGALLVGAGLFLLGGDRPEGAPRWQAIFRHEHNLGALREYERDLDVMLAAVRRYPPQTTVLVALELAGSGGAGADGFLYPWHRHLQWYAPEYLVYLLAPDSRLLLASRPGTPFTRLESGAAAPDLPLPETERLVFVLAANPGARFPLPVGEVIAASPHFYAVACPVPADLRLGPYRLGFVNGPVRAAPPAGHAPTDSPAVAFPR